MCVHAKSLQPCPTLCDPVDCSLGPLSMGILQARMLQWVAAEDPPLGDLPHPESNPHLFYFLHWQAASLPLVSPGKPMFLLLVPFYSFIYSSISSYVVYVFYFFLFSSDLRGICHSYIWQWLHPLWILLSFLKNGCAFLGIICPLNEKESQWNKLVTSLDS